MSEHVDNAVEAIHTMASFEPDNALQVEAYYSSLPELFTELGTALQHQSERFAADYPYAGASTDALSDLASIVGGLADHAGEVHDGFETEHEGELRRLREPRPAEEQWDVANQDG